MKALQEQFEPESKKELYRAELQTRTKKRNEDWAVFGDDLKLLADRAYSDLPDEARERFALNQYLTQLDNVQVAFGVRQAKPKTVDEAVRLTLEMESYLQPARPNRITPCPATTIWMLSVLLQPSCEMTPYCRYWSVWIAWRLNSGQYDSLRGWAQAVNRAAIQAGNKGPGRDLSPAGTAEVRATYLGIVHHQRRPPSNRETRNPPCCEPGMRG